MQRQEVVIRPPNLQVAVFSLIGTSPLVVHRFSAKAKGEILDKMKGGQPAKNKKTVDKLNPDEQFEEARYRFKDGSDGINAAAFRCAMIQACRSAGYQMTLAKQTVFIIADGYDAKEPQIPLVRISGKVARQDDIARIPKTGASYVVIRPAWYEWQIELKVRFDANQFSLEDVTNLLVTAGQQVGVGEGRPCSKNSCGMGWGCWEVAQKKHGK